MADAPAVACYRDYSIVRRPVPGPLPMLEVARTEIDTCISGKDPALCVAQYTVRDGTTMRFERNPNFWGADIDLTCISPWNSMAGYQRAGTLITPLHVLCAAHYQISPGQSISFVTQDNQLVTRQIACSWVHPSWTSQNLYPDFQVLRLDREVSDTISPAKILPDYTKLSDISKLNTVPVIAFNQAKEGIVAELYEIGKTPYDIARFMSPTQATRKQYFKVVIVGDSGSPSFLLLDGEPVLISLWTWGGAGSGTSVTGQKDQINQALNQLGGGYQLTLADLGMYL
jgi:hypothetical protein